MSESRCDRLRSSASSASPSIPDPELRAKMEDVFDDTEDTREEDGDKENVTQEEDSEKVEQLQAEIESLQVFSFLAMFILWRCKTVAVIFQIQLGNVDKNVEKLLASIETLRPLYNQV